jgi:apolipoprotein N-acyltransferase
VRAANTGISGFVDPAGRITLRTGLFEEAAIARELPLLETRTFYTRYGDLFAGACLIATIAGIIGTWVWSRKREGRQSPE